MNDSKDEVIYVAEIIYSRQNGEIARHKTDELTAEGFGKFRFHCATHGVMIQNDQRTYELVLPHNIIQVTVKMFPVKLFSIKK